MHVHTNAHNFNMLVFAEIHDGKSCNIFTYFQWKGLKETPGASMPWASFRGLFIGSMGNRFVFADNENVVGSNRPGTVRSILGESNTLELCGNDHKMIRGAVSSFMKASRGASERWMRSQEIRYFRVAQEMIRITPPAFGNFKRAVTDISLGSSDIPKGWQFFWVSSGTHMDKIIFNEPKKFNPSRFEALSESCTPFSCIPFGAGLRSCSGSCEFTRVEVLPVMHHLVASYEWSELVANEPIT